MLCMLVIFIRSFRVQFKTPYSECAIVAFYKLNIMKCSKLIICFSSLLLFVGLSLFWDYHFFPHSSPGV